MFLDSGRKLKITCGEKTTKIAPSSKLGNLKKKKLTACYG